MPVQAAAQPGINPAEIALLAAPLVLYAIFNVYRDRVNPMAKVCSAFLPCWSLSCAHFQRWRHFLDGHEHSVAVRAWLWQCEPLLITKC